jgi:long-chain acyl-CoA synthetase
VPADIDPSQYTSLVALMDESFRSTPRVAYSFMGKDVSFAQTDSLSRALGRLPAKPGPGQGRPRGHHDAQRAAVPGGGGRHAARRFVVVNVNPLYTPRELEHQLKDSGAKAIVIIENFATRWSSALPTRPSSMWCCAPWATSWAAQGRAGQLRGAQRQEDGAGLQPARRRALQRRHCQGQRGHSSRPDIKPDDIACCSTPAAPPA